MVGDLITDQAQDLITHQITLGLKTTAASTENHQILMAMPILGSRQQPDPWAKMRWQAFDRIDSVTFACMCAHARSQNRPLSEPTSPALLPSPPGQRFRNVKELRVGEMTS